MLSLLSSLMLLGAAASPARAAIAAWWDGIGPQIILQNETTGVGYWTQIITIASIFYVDQNNRIANALFHCNMSTGRFVSQGNWIISKPAQSVSSNTGLASLLLGETAGYRVYYHDKDNQISEIGYTKDDNWVYRGVISQDINSSPAIAAAFTGKVNITIATPRDDRHIAITRYNSDETWHRTTFPRALQGNITNNNTNRTAIAINETAPANFSLAAWDGKPRSMGVSIDNEFTRSVFYIGNDNNLYQVANKNYFWSQRNESTVVWPKADKPNADIAVASESKTSLVRIYYMVNGSLAEVKYENEGWKAWAPVALPPPQPVVETPPPSDTTDTNSKSTAMGLSAAAKAGIGVGVSLGVIAIAALIALFILIRRRKDTPNAEPVPQEPGQFEDSSATITPGTPTTSYGTPDYQKPYAAGGPGMSQYDNYVWEQNNMVAGAVPQYAPAYGIHQLDAQRRPIELYSQTRPTELYAQPMYELPIEKYSHELVADEPRTGTGASAGQHQQQYQQHHAP